MSEIDKKVRDVLSRVFRELPVFGGPLGREIEARLLDEATPEIVALFRGDRTEDEPSDDRLLEEAAAAFTGGGANVKNLGPGVFESMVVRMGHKPRDVAGWFAAGYAAGARREGTVPEENEEKPKPGPWYLATHATRPGRFAVRSNNDGTVAVASLQEATPAVGSIEYSVSLSYARAEFALGDPVILDDTFDIVWTLKDFEGEGARDALIAKGDPESLRLAECHAKLAEHLRDVATRPRPW